MVLLAFGASEPVGPPAWRSAGPWKQQSRVQAHSGLTVVSPPQFAPSARFNRRGGPLPGYLPLRPVSGPRHPRWFSSETAPKPSYLRPPSSYERFPPFWSDSGSKHSTNRRPQSYRHPKKDCNPCNSVPWTPIFKSPAGLSGDHHHHHSRQLVPHVEVYPEPSIQQTAIVAPETQSSVLAPTPLIEHSQLVSLPVGNAPVSPDLLLPPQELVPFPELSPHPVAPIHHSVPFHPEPQGLVPPKESSNVVVTISEPDPPQDVQLAAHDQHSESSSLVDSHAAQNYQSFHNYRQNGGLDIVKSVPLAEYTSSIEYPFQLVQPQPYIDINTQQNVQRPPENTYINSQTPPEQYQNAYVNSPKPAEPNQNTYASSPRPAENSNGTPAKPAEYTYEKSPQTGKQKVSDFILEVSKDAKKNAASDSSPATSNKVSVQTTSSESASPDTSESSKEKASRYELVDGPRGELDPNILSPPPLPPHLTQLLPTYDTAYLHPLFPQESQGVASVVNGALLPPPMPQPMNPSTVNPSDPTIPPKKIQIIIPYTTVNNQQNDQNALGSSLQPVNQSVREAGQQQTWPPIIITEPPQNQPRKVPPYQNFYNFKNYNWSGQLSETSQVQHILAGNIRDLLKKELEPKQNIRLQKNIDNWTALEYSNHKVVGKKNPEDVISHAHAVTVTSIPGTSISHLLLPSKKIPHGYFPTTSGPNYDEPTTTPFPASAVSVNSQPFTTVSKYSTVAYSGPTPRTSLPTTQFQRYRSTTPLFEEENEIPEETTPGPRWSDLKVSIAPGTNEKVYVVTPVSSWGASRRSTRHIDTTEKYIPEASQNFLFTKLEKVSSENQTETPVEKSKVKHKPLYPKSTPLFRVKANQTRFEKVSKFTKPKPIEKFFATTTKPLRWNDTSTASVPTVAVITTEPTTTTASAFPFRNGGELPLEMAQVEFSSSQLTFKNTGSRKTLIKQVRTNNRQGKEGKPVTDTATTQKSSNTTTSSESELTNFLTLTNIKNIFL